MHTPSPRSLLHAASTGTPLELDGRHLTLDAVIAVARQGRRVRLAEPARQAMLASRTLVQDMVARGETVYGITTGFGALARTHIPPAQVRQLQVNLVRSHAAGVGPPLPTEVVRATMLIQANALAAGYSGVRPDVAELLVSCLNLGVHPVVPAQGSVAASGDLAPLAHIGLALIGEGPAEVDGVVLSDGEALARRGLRPLDLEPKEGLALVNGTQVTTALSALAVADALTTLEAAVVAGAMSVEALRGSHRPFAAAIQAVRPQPGQARVATWLRALLAGSQVVVSHQDCGRVQDPYTLRCLPQVLGACLDAVEHCRAVVAQELNAVTDNPLCFPDQRLVLSGGNFHAQPVALAMDGLKAAVAVVAGFAERRIYLLLDGTRSGLSPFLSPDPGLQSGLMTAQNTAAALASENKVLAHPASVDSLPTSAGMEDYVSMGTHAARQAAAIVENTGRVIAIELLCAAQGLDLLRPLRPGRGVAQAHEAVRRVVPPLTADRPPAPDIERVADLVRSGTLGRLLRDAARRDP
ncbi:MAG: histidine ammonia-lyase [Chloroflexi bacterium]|nr:histidine ammonia-lyase [Chloroflexota bacterium]